MLRPSVRPMATNCTDALREFKLNDSEATVTTCSAWRPRLGKRKPWRPARPPAGIGAALRC
jgi:hypothetical protein